MNSVWDIEIVERTSAWQSTIASELAAFDDRKDALLDKLRRGYKLGSNSDPFDANQSWRDLTHLAKMYFYERNIRGTTIAPADSVQRLRKLERVLHRAHNLVARAMRDEVGVDLFMGWLGAKEITKGSPLDFEIDDKKTSSVLIHAADAMKEVVSGLAILEAVAAAAATNAISKVGRPALLPRHCIQGLARVYRKSTGGKPGRGAGPFADFAFEFMIAVGQIGFQYESLIEAIQRAHREFKPSWFDEYT